MTLQEVKSQLARLKNAGFIPSARRGPTGIGFTLEKELGIKENNLSTADIGGHTELKAIRKKSEKTSSLITLFTFNRAVWKIRQSEIINAYGSPDADGRPALWSTVYYAQKNPQNLQIDLPKSGDRVDLIHSSGTPIATWDIATIVNKFTSKLGRLLVVLAENRAPNASGIEEFWFNEAHLYSDPSPKSFLATFAASKIAIDIRMYLKPTGAVRNHGTGFRIKETDIVNLYATKQNFL